MKKIFSLFFIVLILNACQTNKKQKEITDEHTVEFVLDYEGVYKGTLPCADCTGIEVSLTLNQDKTYRYETVYRNKADGRFVYKGKYTLKDNILSIKENDKPVHFFLGESSIQFLDKELKPITGKTAKYYQLKKQRPFNYQGNYETFNEEKGGYTSRLAIQPKGKDFAIKFSASKINGVENCNFFGIGKIKKDTLWVNISPDKNKEILMYIAPSHDNLGVSVFTKNFEKRFAMMQYCGKGGGSIAGEYIKNTITSNNIGVFNNKTTIANVLHKIPLAQIKKKKNTGEFIENIYDDYEIYNHNNKHLFTITPKDTTNIFQKINRVLIVSPFFKTAKGINKNASYQDIKNNYTISKIEPTREHIVLTVDEINASFTIAKTKLEEKWWNDSTKKVNENKIPLNTQIDDFILWWNN